MCHCCLGWRGGQGEVSRWRRAPCSCAYRQRQMYCSRRFVVGHCPALRTSGSTIGHELASGCKARHGARLRNSADVQLHLDFTQVYFTTTQPRHSIKHGQATSHHRHASVMGAGAAQRSQRHPVMDAWSITQKCPAPAVCTC